MRIYLAGPLFTLGERLQNAELASRLRGAGHDVFVPQEMEQRRESVANIFLSDRHGLASSEVVVACMDGADPDSGTCWEVGYGYAKGMAIILYRTDIRSEAPPFGPYNLMLHQSGIELDCRWKTMSEIADRILATLKGLE